MNITLVSSCLRSNVAVGTRVTKCPCAGLMYTCEQHGRFFRHASSARALAPGQLNTAGLSLRGAPADAVSAGFAAESLPFAVPGLIVRSMSNSLRILVLDGVQLAKPLPRINLPLLAMVSWRDGPGQLLPFDLHTVRMAAVLEFSGRYKLERIWHYLQV